MIVFIDNSFTLSLNHNKLQKLTINECLSLAPFWLDCDCLHFTVVSYLLSSTVTDLVLIYESLTCSLRMTYDEGWRFLSFRCPLVNTPQLNTQLLHCTERSHVSSSYSFGKDRIEVTTSKSSFNIVCLFVAVEMCLATRCLQRSGKHASTKIVGLCFLHGPCRGVIMKTNGATVAIPCGSGVEYLHRSPASRRRRRKGSLVPGEYKYGDLVVQVGEVSNLRE
jgi:hypothetical protein